ncbi:FAD-binding domain-containing protein [Artomyces pyxidatus]|uniref:FAD-binding domain-containing protein n=1 Tax=Artomyces pyxidatus TaxID=48021 RepID=A0ACB8T100_9AGAM|nr:FAD-binding domain-containing protein [Artomyces pyxidatus]
MISLSFGVLAATQLSLACASRCRNQPGDAGYPTPAQWSALNDQVDGRLLHVVPSAKACLELHCTEAQWTSGLFRVGIPGSMNYYNWEEDYSVTPPALCLQNGTKCAQGRVPLLAINATSAAHIQAGVKFASRHNLRAAVKSSGHDYLGRSSQKGSLLFWTQYLQDVSFTDSFSIGSKHYGSAVTVGSGVGLKKMYAAALVAGKFVVGGTAATVSAGGGYTQGAGHSAFAPIYGLAADNALQYEIVIANGNLLTVNEYSHPDLFWAVRGGGPGSWGVIISVTFRTYPAFDTTMHTANVVTTSASQTGALFAAHARHVFDWDAQHAGQYFYLYNSPGRSELQLSTLFVNVTASESLALMKPLLDDARALGAAVLNETALTAPALAIVGFADDASGTNGVMGSRLVPATAYRNNPDGIGAAYAALVAGGVEAVLGHIVAGGKVSANAHIDSAVTPKWRTAKTHIIVVAHWDDSASPAQIEQIKQALTSNHVPLLAHMTGESDSGSYVNEADVREPNWKVTFYGRNYARLEAVKAEYDPYDLFIVRTGVGSDRWDADGMCRL